MPFIFKILFGLVGFCLFSGTILLLFLNKTVNGLNKLPDENRRKKKEAHLKSLKLMKLILWTAPFSFVILLYYFHKYSPSDFSYLALFFSLAYIALIEHTLINRGIVKGLK